MGRRFIAGLIVVTLLLSGLYAAGAHSQETDAGTEAGVRLLRSDAEGIILELSTPEYRIETVPGDAAFDRFTVPNATLTAEPGRPQVPMVSTVVGVPADSDVTLRVVDDTSVTLPGRYDLSPAVNAAPIENDLRPGETQVTKDETVYTRDALYPDAPAQISEDAWLRDQRLLRIEFYPLQYNPATGAVQWHQRLRVELAFEGASVAPVPDTPPSTESPFEPVLRDTLLNYESAQAWRTAHKPSLDRSLQTTPASSETRYKIVVDEDGLYRVTYEDLQQAGLDVDAVDPASFHLTNQGRDVAIYVADEGDGFDDGDYIEFYGQRFRGDVLAQTDAAQDLFWLVDRCAMAQPRVLCPSSIDTFEKDYAGQLEKYTDENVYWLTVGGTGGPRMDEVDGTPDSGASTPDYYTATVRAEQSNHWYTHHFSSEDTWFWDRTFAQPNPLTRTYTTTLTGVASAPLKATIRGEVAARTSKQHVTRFLLNDRSEPLTDTSWYGKTNFRFATQVPQTELREGENELHFVLDSTFDDVFFNWFEIEYARRFLAEDDQLWFTMQEEGTWRYVIGNFMSSSSQIYDVSDPLRPTRIRVEQLHTYLPIITSGQSQQSVSDDTAAAHAVTFGHTNDGPAHYFVVGSSAVKSPKRISEYAPTDLTATSNGADYIFITHADFVTATKELATFRAAQGMRTAVVDVADVYNQFGYGIFGPVAIKNFLTYAYDNWQSPAPSYVLLVGGGHWNFKGYGVEEYGEPAPIYMPPNLAFVDPWQGEVDSTNLLATLVGDDPLPDFAIGRLPVNSVDELQTVIEKTKTYEQVQQATPADWHRRVLFVADNQDSAGDFAQLSESIISDYLPATYVADRIYLDDFIDAGMCTKNERCGPATKAITETLSYTGTTILNYIGHASVNYWSNEPILAENDKYTDIASLSNDDRLPVLLSMDCLDGYWIHPTLQSLTVNLLVTAEHGIPAGFSPTGLGVATGHDALHRGFYKATFEDEIWRLGPATTSAKVALFDSGFNYDLLNTFTIFGDPALQIAHDTD